MKSREIPFTKLHGLGNDFVLIDERAGGVGLNRAMVRAIADRKRGVGFDQLLVLKPSARVHAILDIYNADGSMAEMCGNGLRAAGLYVWRRGARDPELVVETAAGDRRLRALGPLNESNLNIECEMGVPKFPATPKALQRGVRLRGKLVHPVCVNVGNPHAVVFVQARAGGASAGVRAPTDAEVAAWGRALETHRAFPRRTNVEFVRVRDTHVIEAQVWERGVGITEACGTGAVAAACVAIAQGLANSPVEVRFAGGVAEVRWDGKDQPAFLRGHAQEVFSGVWTG